MSSGAGGKPPRFGGSWRPKNKKQLEKWKKDAGTKKQLKTVTLLAEEVIPPEAMLTSSGISAAAAASQGGRGLRKKRSSRRARGGRGGNGQQMQAGAGEEEVPGLVLDGFMLLEHCLVDLPDEATRADLQGKEIRSIVQDDMTLFTNLAYLNLAENEVNLKACESFPALQELHLTCNMIRDVAPLQGFAQLETLDLSYNQLSESALVALTMIPKLRRLDLTCNGLLSIPQAFEEMKLLESLNLEHNNLEKSDTIITLASCPRLKELNVSSNFFAEIPEEVGGGTGFPRLEWFNLSNNEIAYEEALLPLLDFPSLAEVILFGNPIVSSVAPRTFEKLDKAQEDGRVLNVVRTVPSMKSKAGYHAYTDFRLTQVVEAKMPTAAQWKAAGNAALFAEDDWREHLMQREDDDDDARNIDDEEREETVEMMRGYEEDGEDDYDFESGQRDEGPSFFLTGVDAGGRRGGGGRGSGIWDEDEEEEEGEGEDGTLMMPTNLLQPSFIKGETKRDPGKLRSAINALRYALKHPNTGVNDKLPGNIGYMKTTGATRAKQMPRIEYKARPKRGRGAGASGATAVGLQGSGSNPALQNIEYVLDRMQTRMATDGSDDRGLANSSDQTMSSLIKMVNNVMSAFDD